jgi:queuine tRNA-ribosyltransferase
MPAVACRHHAIEHVDAALDRLEDIVRRADDPRPLDEESSWPSARTYARAYLHHLVKAGETLGAMLLSEINIAYYQFLMQGIRGAVAQGTFEEFYQRTREDWARGDIAPRA